MWPEFQQVSQNKSGTKFEYDVENPVMFEYLSGGCVCVASMDITVCRFLPGDALTGFYCRHPDFLLGVCLCFVFSNWLGRCKMLNNKVMWHDINLFCTTPSYKINGIWRKWTAFVCCCSRTTCSMSITRCSFLCPHSWGLNSAVNSFFFMRLHTFYLPHW